MNKKIILFICALCSPAMAVDTGFKRGQKYLRGLASHTPEEIFRKIDGHCKFTQSSDHKKGKLNMKKGENIT